MKTRVHAVILDLIYHDNNLHGYILFYGDMKSRLY